MVLAMPPRPVPDLPELPELPAPSAAEAGGVPDGFEAPPGLGPYAAACERTLATLDLQDGDAAAASVARGLARALDGAYGDGRELAVLAPRYLAALKALLATRESAPAVAESPAAPALTAY